MKILYIIILALIVIFCSGFNIEISYQPEVDKLEAIFKSTLPSMCGVIYTKVPRGLIVSVDERCLFNAGETRIKESSLVFLNSLSEILEQLPNTCVIEDHTEEQGFDKSWELSTVRASNLAEYLTKYKKLSAQKIFSLGFGEIMPFRDNVAPQKGFDNRVDFVIIEYEARR